MNKSNKTIISDPPLANFIFSDTRLAFLWLIIRVYVGWQWAVAGYEKIVNPVWTGQNSGMAIKGFVMGALTKTSGPHPDVPLWYAAFLKGFVLQHTIIFSYIISYGELFVGIGLILGLFTGIAAFFGAFMNMNYLFAGTISINPLLFLFELFIILAWKIAGWYGVDSWLLPLLGTPWQTGKIFRD